MKNVFILLSLNISLFGTAQKIQNLKLKDYQIGELPIELKESSGLDLFGEDLFSFNDSGNDSQIFKISKKDGHIEETLHTKLKNIDWEALTNDK